MTEPQPLDYTNATHTRGGYPVMSLRHNTFRDGTKAIIGEVLLSIDGRPIFDQRQWQPETGRYKDSRFDTPLDLVL